MSRKRKYHNDQKEIDSASADFGLITIAYNFVEK